MPKKPRDAVFVSQFRQDLELQVRIPPSLDRRLAMEAAEENVSLNRYMSQKLAG